MKETKEATMMAMQEAIDNLSIVPKKVHVDGNDKFSFSIPHISIIRGDQTDILIGAASIVAKVTRDRYMKEMGISYPEYYFEKHNYNYNLIQKIY
jgi:ribonuclease HII